MKKILQKIFTAQPFQSTMTVSPFTYAMIICYLYLSGAYIYHKQVKENPLDLMCPEPYVCVIPPENWKARPPMGLTIYKKIEV
tara:strand:- start:245 stop:493 length:249 start_codon:yes stop_codon:yes gene_type:complete